MKISWGLKIVIVFALFAGGMAVMVAVSVSENVDLVSENYYELEIKYQEQIDLLKSSDDFENKIALYTEDGNIIIKFSSAELLNRSKGEIYFYRSSDARKDFKTMLSIDSEGVQKIPISNLDRGLWKVRITLNQNGKKYFAEKKIFLN